MPPKNAGTIIEFSLGEPLDTPIINFLIPKGQSSPSFDMASTCGSWTHLRSVASGLFMYEFNDPRRIRLHKNNILRARFMSGLLPKFRMQTFRYDTSRNNATHFYSIVNSETLNYDRLICRNILSIKSVRWIVIDRPYLIAYIANVREIQTDEMWSKFPRSSYLMKSIYEWNFTNEIQLQLRNVERNIHKIFQ